LVRIGSIAAPAEACRLALVLAMDVSSSVDDTEDRLQRNGLAAALMPSQVQNAFFISPDPVALHVFEWSGRGHQTDLVEWIIIRTPSDLSVVANQLTNSMRNARSLPTAMGHALAYASMKLLTAPPCLFQTIDMAGDGVNNAGFGPDNVYATFPFDGVTVNGLVITDNDDTALGYYIDQVMRGPLAFVEIAKDFTDFEVAMQRKLIRELSSQIMGRKLDQNGAQG
jgi:hypothetical protein